MSRGIPEGVRPKLINAKQTEFADEDQQPVCLTTIEHWIGLAHQPPDPCGSDERQAEQTEFGESHPGLPDDHRALEPPDPIPNSEVKRCIADGSVGSPHVRVGHRQASN
jgi:hypothetical protein